MTRVLIVDDVRLLAEIRSTPLGRVAVEVALLRPGDDVVERARFLHPDLVVLEEGEFYPEAFDACRSLGDTPETAGIPVLYIGLSLHRERCTECGVAEFLSKPVTRHDLDQAVRRLLGGNARRGARRVVDVPCELQQEGKGFAGRCIELSLDGAFVRFDDPPREQPGVLHFQNGARPIEVAIEIVREGDGRGGERGWGLQFLPLGVEASAQLARFVRAAAERRGHAVETSAPDAT